MPVVKDTNETQEECSTPRRPTFGRDELNLAEFPLSALASRPSPGQKTLVFQDTIRDRSTGQDVTRRLTVTASERFGLPTSGDDDVVVALIQLTKAQNNFSHRTVRFSRYALVNILGWPDNGQSYRRLEESLMRWLTVTLHYERAWWDKGSKSWVDEHFHILDNVTLENLEFGRRRRASGQSREPSPSSFSWNGVVFKSFRAENLKRLDLSLYFRLKLAPAKRAFRFLDKRFYRRRRIELDLREFACEHVGLSRRYDSGKIKEKLQPSIEELERVGFLAPLPRDERYVRVGSGHWRVVFLRERSILTSQPKSSGVPALERELVARGVAPWTATELLSSHPHERIAEKIEIFDWLLAAGEGRTLKRPAGYLVDSIRKGYGVPPGFVSKSVRAASERVLEAKRRALARQAAKRSAREEARLEATKDPVRRYWNSLTAAEQELLKQSALTEADPWLLERYLDQRERKPHLAAPFLEVIIDRYIERHRLSPGPR